MDTNKIKIKFLIINCVLGVKKLLKLFRKSKDSQKNAKSEAQSPFYRILIEFVYKGMISQWILPALTFSAHGRPSAVEPVELVKTFSISSKPPAPGPK